MVTDNDIGQIIQAFASAALNPEGWMPALSMMSSALGASSCAIELADLNTGVASLNCTLPLDDEIVDLYEERIYHINPRVRRGRLSPVGAIMDDRSLLIDGDPDMGEFMDWLDKTPNRYVQAAKLFQGNGHEIYCGSYFSREHGPPDSWHEDVHRLLTPHLVNFVAAGRVLSANRLNNELVTIDHLQRDHAFVLLDRAGRLVECSAGFEKLLRSTDVLSVREGRLVAAQARHRSKLNRFLGLSVAKPQILGPPLPIRLAPTDNRAGLILRAVPIELGNDIFDILRPAALVTFTDLDHPRTIKHGELVELFDLTPREAEVAALVGEGFATGRVAQALTLSEYTVKQHLKAVFAKIGISRQPELVSIISRLP